MKKKMIFKKWSVLKGSFGGGQNGSFPIKEYKRSTDWHKCFSFFGVFIHDKLVQVLTESFKQNSKINPVARAR